jgi:N-methylhydantoinase A/oxoprolinase/acetone carboxylase beta subunit
MPSKLSSCVIGIDVGGTNTDSVILQGDNVLAWHKTPTTSDIQEGVERAIEQVVKKADIPPGHVDSVKIGKTVRTTFHSIFASVESFLGSLRISENSSGI